MNSSRNIIILIVVMVLLLSGIGIVIHRNDNATLLDEEQRDQFQQAVNNQDYTTLEEFANNGDKLNFVFEDGSTPLEVILKMGRADIADKMLDSGFDLSKVDDINYADNITSMVGFYFSDDENSDLYKDVIKIVVNQIDEDIEMEDRDGYSVLVNMVMYKKYELIDIVLEQDIDIDKEYNGASVLLYASSEGISTENIAKILDKGADINATDVDGNNALIRAIIEYDNELIDYLLIENININITNSKGDSALHVAVKYKNNYAVQKLLKVGIDKTVQNKNSKTAEQLASDYGFKEIEDMIKGQ